MPQNWMIDPDDKGTYTMDWSGFLSALGRTISTSSWTITPTGLTKDADAVTNSNTKTTITVSGGTAGIEYTAGNQITLDNGLKVTRRIKFGVKEL